jgi:hypothetical protein
VGCPKQGGASEEQKSKKGHRSDYAAALGFCFVTTTVFAEHEILSVYTDNVGMVSPQGKKLYVKVTATGRMTYLDEGKQSYYTRERRLTKPELDRLRAMLQNPSLSAVAEVMHADADQGANDYLTIVQIAIPRNRSTQQVRLIGFNGCPGRDYPPTVKDLLRLVDELRASTYRLSASCEKPAPTRD